MITSTANPRIKAVAKLRQRSERARTDQFIIEGDRQLDLALRAGLTLETLFITEGAEVAHVRSAEMSGVQVVEVNDTVMTKLSYRQNPGSALAVARRPDTGLQHIPVAENGLYLIAESIEKPGNIGAMLRTADAAGVTGVIATGERTDLTNPNVVAASQGALFTIPVAVASLEAARAWLTTNSITAIIATPDSDTPPWAVDMTGACAIVIGSEHDGLSRSWERSTGVTIPGFGAVDSLNASVAAAVMVFEAVRQRAIA